MGWVPSVILPHILKGIVMNKSESIVKLAQALLKFQSEITKIKKGSKNPLIGNSYASLPEILDIIDPVLTECGLILNQFPVGSGDKVTLITFLAHAESGEFFESEFAMTPVKIVKGSGAIPSIDPQSTGSCITYMRRYAITSILKLNVDDDDGNAASDKRKDDGNAASQQEQHVQHHKVVSAYEVSRSATESKAMILTKLSDFDSVKLSIDKAQTTAELKDIGKQIAELEKTAEERDLLLEAYKERMEYIKGGEGM